MPSSFQLGRHCQLYFKLRENNRNYKLLADEKKISWFRFSSVQNASWSVELLNMAARLVKMIVDAAQEQRSFP